MGVYLLSFLAASVSMSSVVFTSIPCRCFNTSRHRCSFPSLSASAPSAAFSACHPDPHCHPIFSAPSILARSGSTKP